MDDRTPIRRALISVYDKEGIADFARALADGGVEIVSTGSTAARIREAGVEVTDVSEVTGSPEILDGRVKTLHPTIHSAILADRGNPTHVETLEEHDVTTIDLVVVNLYPFRETVAAGKTRDEIIEMIDIGGPAMVRGAAKNHPYVTVVMDAVDYGTVLEEVAAGGVTFATRRRLAAKAFAATSAYDAAVAAWLAEDDDFPAQLITVWERAQTLRYGENPHQQAAYYRATAGGWGVGSARQLGGKELSYNNLLDTDAAWGLAADFAEPCIAIIKHTNPAGVAVAGSLAEAYPAALAGDPVSAFGGIVAANRRIDADTARQIVEVFTEVVVAPGYEPDALELLTGKQNLRILEVARPQPLAEPVLRSVSGGLLVQDADTAPEDPSGWSIPTKAQPTDAQLAELRFAWQVCKHVKSNAIVLTRDRAAVGVGAGQMSRVDSVRLAVEKSGGRAAGAVLASDAFFPFRDGPDAALAAGVVAIIQPGGSVRDEEVIAACDERGIPMVMTGRRHFRH